MTTCTPDYLSEDLIDCELGAAPADEFGCFFDNPRDGRGCEGHLVASILSQGDWRDCWFSQVEDWDAYKYLLFGQTPPAHPVDFPRCKLRPMITPKMGMMQWYATEGGRKCPMCGRYAKAEDLGNLSRWIGNTRVSAYGHIEGRGCNKPAPEPRP